MSSIQHSDRILSVGFRVYRLAGTTLLVTGISLAQRLRLFFVSRGIKAHFERQLQVDLGCLQTDVIECNLSGPLPLLPSKARGGISRAYIPVEGALMHPLSSRETQ